MPRVAYDIVAIEANRLLMKMITSSDGDPFFYWDLYIDFINACGWTDQEFDQETLRRVDAGWDDITWN